MFSAMTPQANRESLPQETEQVAVFWVIARVLFFSVICVLIAWSAFGAAPQDVSFQLQRNGRSIWQSEQRWAKKVGKDRALEVMCTAAHFIQSELYNASPETSRKTVRRIILSLEEKMSVSSVTIQNVIHINSNYIENFQGDASLEMEALIYKAMAYVWVWDGKGRAPLGLLDAMADFLSISAGFPPVATKVDEDEQWSTWDKMPGLFLHFCETTKPGFVRGLNAKLAVGWDESFFQDLMGESIKDLWATYKLWQINGMSSLHAKI